MPLASTAQPVTARPPRPSSQADSPAVRGRPLPRLLRFYYGMKPYIPRYAQVQLRRALARVVRYRHSTTWPLISASARAPASWPGWPDQKDFAVVLTHDVESSRGLQRVERTMALDHALGFHASFNFVPERSAPSALLRTTLAEHGCEVGVHGLCHDGRLLESAKVFRERAVKINSYLDDWSATGFRAPSMHGHLEWFHQLDIAYDLSCFVNDPFEPLSGGKVDTPFPFWVGPVPGEVGYVELPYTLTQDHTIFTLLREPGIDIWRRQVARVAELGGLVLVNTHPDYMAFEGDDHAIDEYPSVHYSNLLRHIKATYAGRYYHALPKDVAHYCRQQWGMKSHGQDHP